MQIINFKIFIVFIVIIFILISLYKELIKPGFTFIIASATLGFFQIITPSEILMGFANEQVAIIIMLLILGDIFKKTPLLNLVFDKIFQNAKNPKSFLGRMMILVASLSAFLNNTPLVAIMMPYVYNWSKQNKIAVSKLLIPLSFASILGGCTTLIGTSTNMIINGLLLEQKIIPDLKSIAIFDFSYVGIPMMIIGILYLYLFSDKILHSNSDSIYEYKNNIRKYIVEIQVKKSSELINKTIKETSLINIEDLFLLEIFRKGKTLSKNPDKIVIREDDILLFVGQTEIIANLINYDKSLIIPSVGMFSKKKKYNATVIAIHRNGEKIYGKTKNLKMKAGDVLLLLAEDNFIKRVKDVNDFYVISKIKEIGNLDFYKSLILVGGTILIILLSAFHFIKLFMGLLILLCISVSINISKPKDILKSVDFDLIFVIALSLSIGTAMTKTGMAQIIANFMIYIFMPMGKIGILSGIFIITSLLASYITSKAAAAIIFPISLSISLELEINYMPFVLIVAFASAANFITPIGYQTNLMIFNLGGYKFKDFFKIGLPLTVIYMIVTILIFNYMYF
ncbi:MAG: SLC13 family permease [Bacteroidetes bacterium 4572_128]|nr:MAG: SLC13 family permease [Bacteroidetes bacterium 4572_128]